MKKKVLLVEYDSPTIDSLKEILSSPVFEISIVSESEVAKKLIRKKNFDIIISAAMLPKFHGFELSRYTKEVKPASKVIIISGVYKGPEYRNQALREYNADEFFEKPLKRESFLNAVLNLLGLSHKDVEGKPDPGTTQIPAFDTKKIKSHSGESPEDNNKLSSEDIFGDLIENVENIDEHKIELDEDISEEKKNQDNQLTQILSRDVLNNDIKKETPKKNKVEKIEIDLKDFIKPEPQKKEKKVEKKIEEDIMKKFEETLSGLGIKDTSHKNKEKREKIEDRKTPPEEKIQSPSPEEPGKKEDDNEIEGYELIELIARGGMAEIYKAKKKGVEGFEKILVIKKILSGYGDDGKYIEMFVDEAKIAAELSHTNIVQIYDFGKKDNYYFIAMEYVEGKDLRLILRKLEERGEKLEEYISVYISLKILEALAYAHSAKDKYGNNLEIVHRDISPPNILVSYNGEIKITDFGVSKASNKLHQTLSGALKGKLLYMSPEQAKAEKDIDKRSDIYSVGAILFELLTGKKLFKGSSEIEILKMVQDGRISQPTEYYPEIDPELERIILKALEKDKSKRYSDASEMSKDLESYLYKNYNHIPTPIHVSNKIYNLFKSDIIKDGIRVSLQQEPYDITRITAVEKAEEPVEDMVPAEPENIEPEIDDISRTEVENSVSIGTDNISDIQSIDMGQTEFIEAETNLNPELEDKKEVPAIDIEPETEEPEPIQSSSVSHKEHDIQIPDSFNIEKFKKKRSAHPLLILLFVIVAVAAGIYFLSKSRNSIETPVDKTALKTEKPVGNGDNLNASVKNGKGEETLNNTDTKDISGITDQSQDSSKNATQDNSVKTKNESSPAVDKLAEEKLKAEKKKKEEEKRRKIELEKKKRAALEKKKREAEAEKKRLEEEARKRQEEERLKKLEAEKKRIQEEEAKKRAEEEKRKKLLEEQNRVKPGQIVPLSQVDQKPVPISTPPPVLPRGLRTSSKSILVSFLIGDSGLVEKVRLLKKSDKKSIDNIIRRTILKWKYTPAVKDRVKVKVWRTIPLNIK